MEEKKKPSPGAIMASILANEGKFTSEDFNKSTKDFFESKGVNCKINQ